MIKHIIIAQQLPLLPAEGSSINAYAIYGFVLFLIALPKILQALTKIIESFNDYIGSRVSERKAKVAAMTQHTDQVHDLFEEVKVRDLIIKEAHDGIISLSDTNLKLSNTVVDQQRAHNETIALQKKQFDEDRADWKKEMLKMTGDNADLRKINDQLTEEKGKLMKRITELETEVADLNRRLEAVEGKPTDEVVEGSP